MEGVASEAASLAGHLKLSNLCWIYDNNHVTLDGPAEWSFSEDVTTRFKGYGWNVTHVTDANDFDMLIRGYDNFLKSKDGPTLIVVDSHIGYVSPHKQDSYEAHGGPLGEGKVKLVKKNYGWTELANCKKTNLAFDGAGEFYPNQYRGRNIHFGVREHAMGAIVNGMTLSKLRAFSATFFNFSDYMRHSMRLGALMEIPSIYIFTHDSIGVGEDGPTHQPIDQLASLRAMPNMLILRPGDANEVVEAYKVILQHTHGPSTLVLTRQAMPTFDRTKYAPASGVAKGAYVLADADAPGGKPDVILMGSGSEVSLCVDAYEKLKGQGINARVVSMPSWELFERQDAAYKESVLPANVTARVSVEMASTFGWERYTGPRGKIIGMRGFGASASR